MPAVAAPTYSSVGAILSTRVSPGRFLNTKAAAQARFESPQGRLAKIQMLQNVFGNINTQEFREAIDWRKVNEWQRKLKAEVLAIQRARQK